MDDAIDVYDLEEGHVVNDWLIWKNLGPNKNGHVYQVSDLKMELFGKMYIEKIDNEDLVILVESINFLTSQQSIGNSFRFSTIIGAEVFINQYAFMVVQDRPGPTLQQLLDCEKANNCFTPSTCAYFAIDYMQTIEAIVNSGHVLRNFDPNQWKFDTTSRIFYLADVTDVVASSDPRCNIFENDFVSDHLKWRGNLRYAPISFSKFRDRHRMNELDMIETAIFVFYNLVVQKLPWDRVCNQDKVIKQKNKFLFEWKKHLNGDLEMFETVLRNMAEYLKQAIQMHSILETGVVVDGAWYPKGTRAGALSSAVNYAAIFESFHKLIMHDQCLINWREVVLCFEVDVTPEMMTPELLEISKVLELSKHLAQESEIEKRNDAIRKHYEVLEEDYEAEQRINLENARNCVDDLVAKTKANDEEIEGKPEVVPRKVRGPYRRKTKKRVSSPIDEENDAEIEEKPEIVSQKETVLPKKRGRKKLIPSPVKEDTATPKKRRKKCDEEMDAEIEEKPEILAKQGTVAPEKRGRKKLVHSPLKEETVQSKKKNEEKSVATDDGNKKKAIRNPSQKGKQSKSVKEVKMETEEEDQVNPPRCSRITRASVKNRQEEKTPKTRGRKKNIA